MIKLIGLMDYDALIQKKYRAPNYDVGLVYAYLKTDPNINVRLISSLSYANLIKYDEIYVFKVSRYLQHPSSAIKDYYKLNIKEYGKGFINRDVRPFFKETLYTTPDFTCYNPILQLSFDKPHHPLSWNTNKAVKGNAYAHVKLFEEIEGEYLRRDLSLDHRRICIHDDPNVLFTHPEQLKVLDDLLSKKTIIYFTQLLDVSLLKDTNIIERVITQSNLATLRNNIIITSMNESALWFIDYYLNNKCKKTDVLVLYEKGKNCDYYLCSLLDLNYYNNKSNYTLRLRPYYDKEVMMSPPLTHCAYRFLFETPFLMSYYEYVFYLGCREINVPKKLVRTDEEIYDFILTKYGMPRLLLNLERWIQKHPQYKDKVFIGGSSTYDSIRKKAYKPYSKYAFEVEQKEEKYEE